MAYVSARDKDKSSHDVVYVDQNGQQVVRHAGSRAWRNNNPGNIRSGGVASEHGAIGVSGGFAVFPDYEAGRLALVALLKTASYAKLTIIKAVSHYAPPKENDSKAYAKHLQKLTGLDGKTKLGDLNDQQIESVARAIEKLEGTLPGAETPMARIVGVAGSSGDYLRSRPDDTTVDNLEAMEMMSS